MKNSPWQWLYQYLTVLHQWHWTQQVKGYNYPTSYLDTVSGITPTVKKDIKKQGSQAGLGVEGVKCLKMVIGLENLTYPERPEGFGSFSLVKWGLRGIPFLPSSVRYWEMKALSSRGFTVMGKFSLQAQNKLFLWDQLKAGTGCLEVWCHFPWCNMQGFVWQCPRSPKALLPTHTGPTALSDPGQSGLSPSVFVSLSITRCWRVQDTPSLISVLPFLLWGYSSAVAIASIKRASLAPCQLHPCNNNINTDTAAAVPISAHTFLPWTDSNTSARSAFLGKD